MGKCHPLSDEPNGAVFVLTADLPRVSIIDEKPKNIDNEKFSDRGFDSTYRVSAVPIPLEYKGEYKI